MLKLLRSSTFYTDFFSHAGLDNHKIAVLDERNIETKEIASHLKGCFPDFEVTTSLTRSGQWFQNDEEAESSTSKTTLVLAIFLNACDWIELMRQNPINAPFH